jgi:arsenate reductase
MAHAYLEHFGKGKVSVRSAGLETHGVNPTAVKVLKEDGIDIAHHTSNHIDEYANDSFDFVITVCDHARENCPFFPAHIKSFHQNFVDPAKATGSHEEILKAFRQVRDQIKDYSRLFIAENVS